MSRDIEKRGKARLYRVSVEVVDGREVGRHFYAFETFYDPSDYDDAPDAVALGMMIAADAAGSIAEAIQSNPPEEWSAK